MNAKRLGGMYALVVCVMTSTVWAQDSTGEAPSEAQAAQTQDYRDKAARGLFEAGSVAFEEGRYEEALGHFQQAYQLSPNRHLLLYNVGSSFDRLRKDREALENFEKYLQLNPTAQNRAAVESRVKVLRDAIGREDRATEERKRQDDASIKRQADEQASTDAQTPTVTAPALSESSRGLSPLYTYVGIGVTAALGGVTVWSYLNTTDWQDTYEAYKGQKASERNFTDSKNAYDKGTKAAQRTVILLGSTATIGVATAVLAAFFTDWKGDRAPDTRATAWVRKDGAGMELQHAF